MNAARLRRGTRTRPTRRGGGVAASLVLLAALAACAPRGDFGRPAPSVIGDRVLPFAGRAVAEMRGEPASWFMQTDDERELRARAYRFLMPAHEWQVAERMLADLARHRILPPPLAFHIRRSYWDALHFSRETSPAPLFRRISQDVTQDAALIPPLKAMAERVLQADQARLGFLLHVRDLDDRTAEEAALRVAENRCLIAWIRAEARERVERYRYALERLAVEAPQREAIEAERALTALGPVVATLDTLEVGSLEACGDLVATGRPSRPGVVGPRPAADGIVYKD